MHRPDPGHQHSDLAGDVLTSVGNFLTWVRSFLTSVGTFPAESATPWSGSAVSRRSRRFSDRGWSVADLSQPLAGRVGRASTWVGGKLTPEISLKMTGPAGRVRFPMRLLPVILALLLLSACSREKKPNPGAGGPKPAAGGGAVTPKDVMRGQDGLTRLAVSQELFTGVLKTTYPNGAPRAEIHFKDGKRHGPFKMVHPDGSL